MTRRGPGEGTVFRAKDGRWRGAITVKRPDGSTFRKTVSARTRPEACAKVRALLAAQAAGTLPTGRDMTVKEWLDYWLIEVCPQRVRASSLTRYETVIRRWVLPVIGQVRLSRLRPEHVERVVLGMRRAGQAPGSQLMAFRILSRALTVAVRRGHLAVNPCTRLDAPSARREEVRPLDVAEVRAVLAAAGDDAARWALAFSVGMRQGEVLGLSWDDVDLDASTVTVRWALQYRTGAPTLDAPKSAAGRRVVHLPPSVARLLAEHRRRQTRARLEAPPGSWKGFRAVVDGEQRDVPLVFARPDGSPIRPAADWRAFKALLRAAGVRDARVHDARHTAATVALAVGADVRTVADQLGHSSPTLTLGTYAHAVDATRRQLAARVEAALWAPAADG